MRKSSYTLTEILVVIAIIAILAGIIFGVANSVHQRKADLKTLAMMKQIQFGLEECKRKFGYYPVQNSFGDLAMERIFMKDGDDEPTGADVKKKYSVTFKKACDYKSLMVANGKLVDSFGSPLQYKSNGKSFTIFSKGFDGKAAGIDGVTDTDANEDGIPDADEDNVYLD